MGLWACRWMLVLAGFAGVALVGCQEASFVPPPAPEVSVAVPVRQDVTVYFEFEGELAATAVVEIRPRVEGILEPLEFTAGDWVRAGQLLFRLDPKPFEAKLSQARAELSLAKAQVSLAEFEYARVLTAFEKKASSEVELKRAEAGLEQAKAGAAAAAAAVETADLNLGYTKISSPIDGFVERVRIDPGNLVGPGMGAALTRVVQDREVYAEILVSERDALAFRRKLAEGVAGVDAPQVVFVRQLVDEGYPHVGWAVYADPEVDASTGTLLVRAVLGNERRLLIPGAFVRGRSPRAVRRDALMVSERAIGQDQTGFFVLVVGEGDVVEKRGIVPGELVGLLREVRSGIGPEDRVIVAGIQRARPGSKVRTVAGRQPEALSGGDVMPATAPMPAQLRDRSRLTPWRVPATQGVGSGAAAGVE